MRNILIQETQELAAESYRNVKNASEKYDSRPINDQTRSIISGTFVRWFFYLLGGTLIISLIYNLISYSLFRNQSLILDVENLLLLVTGSIGTPLGFIVGYYFKSKEN